MRRSGGTCWPMCRKPHGRAVPGDTGSKGHWFPRAHRDNSRGIAPSNCRSCRPKERWPRNPSQRNADAGQAALTRGVDQDAGEELPPAGIAIARAPRATALGTRGGLAAPPHCSGSSLLRILTTPEPHWPAFLQQGCQEDPVSSEGLVAPIANSQSPGRKPSETRQSRHRRLPVRRRSLRALCGTHQSACASLPHGP